MGEKNNSGDNWNAENSWHVYSKLVLNELERLNENHDKIDKRLNEINLKLNDVKTIEKNVQANANWIEKVNEVWSPSQMQLAKDEIYKQKGKWISVVAIITFIQIILGIAISMWDKFK